VRDAQPNVNPALYPGIEQQLESADPRPIVYWHLARQPATGRLALEYWFFYLYNDFTDKHEADYWLSQANLDAAPKNEQKGFADAIAALKPYVAAGKFITFDGDTDLVPGVRAHASRGHTGNHPL